MKSQENKPFPLVSEGEHRCKLTEVVEVEATKEFLKPGQDTKRWCWRFVTDEIDEDTGNPVDFLIYTGRIFGDSRATLTRLYKNLFKRVTEDSAREIDTDDLVGKVYDIAITHVKKANGDGMRADFLWISPYVKKSAAPAPVDEDDEAPAKPAPRRELVAAGADRDPFADD